jgi:hypothetical protein
MVLARLKAEQHCPRYKGLPEMGGFFYYKLEAMFTVYVLYLEKFQKMYIGYTPLWDCRKYISNYTVSF